MLIKNTCAISAQKFNVELIPTFLAVDTNVSVQTLALVLIILHFGAGRVVLARVRVARERTDLVDKVGGVGG